MGGSGVQAPLLAGIRPAEGSFNTMVNPYELRWCSYVGADPEPPDLSPPAEREKGKMAVSL